MTVSTARSHKQRGVITRSCAATDSTRRVSRSPYEDYHAASEAVVDGGLRGHKRLELVTAVPVAANLQRRRSRIFAKEMGSFSRST